MIRIGSGYFALEEQRQLQSQYRDNGARMAEAATAFVTDGFGQVAAEEAVSFPSPFIHRPVIKYGFIVDQLPDATYWQMPRATGGAARWVTDPGEFNPDDPPPGGVFYDGFYPYVTVWVPPQPLVGTFTASQVYAYREVLADNPPVVRITHQFSFRGEAYKKLPRHVDAGLKQRRIDLSLTI